MSRTIGAILLGTAAAASSSIPDARPPPLQRKFNSTAVEKYLADLVPRFVDPDLGTMFANSLPNTLDTTIQLASADDSFIITGDIEAMWLRDSTNQLMPYFEIPDPDPELLGMMRGAVLRQLRSVLIDGYANAFNIGPNGNGHQTDIRFPPMTPDLWEGKFELDSLAAVLKLSYKYWQVDPDASVFDSADSPYIDAVATIVGVITEQQASTEEDGDHPHYNFSHAGGGRVERYPSPESTVRRCGLSKCGFRPSDDATGFAFLIPSNAMAATELFNTASLLETLADPRASPLAAAARALGAEIRAAVAELAVSPAGLYAYEVNGFGQQHLHYDDANVRESSFARECTHTHIESPEYTIEYYGGGGGVSLNRALLVDDEAVTRVVLGTGCSVSGA